MSDPTTRLKELLAAHGSQISHWPEASREFGVHALQNPELAALIEEEKRFEQILRTRHVPPASADFTQRIIAAAHMRKQQSEVNAVFSELRTGIRPAAFAAMLVLGFIIGFGVITPLSQNESLTAQSVSDDEGAVL